MILALAGKKAEQRRTYLKKNLKKRAYYAGKVYISQRAHSLSAKVI